jgi:hypothetical protein
MDETYIKVAGQWKYLYRAVDKSGANTSAIRSVDADACIDVESRQSKYDRRRSVLLNGILIPMPNVALVDQLTLTRKNRAQKVMDHTIAPS